MRILVAGVLSTAVFACGVAPAHGAATAETAVAVSPAIAARVDAILAGGVTDAAGSAPGIAVAIVENGRVAYERAAGFENVAAKRAATTHTRFALASITKTFTAVSVMQLAERGKIRLGDTLATYLPDAPHAREVTIRQLLMHTSGIANYGDAAFRSGAVGKPTTPAAIVASVAAKPLDFPPGTKYGYSNTGYVLLGLVVEKVAGTSLAAYERAHIFAPAGMHDTTVGPPPDGSAATGYLNAKASPAPTYDPSWLYADGDLVATAGDVARFDIALMNGTLLAPHSFAQMRANPIRLGEEDATYGLGVSLFPLGGLTFVGHHGGVPGFEGDNEMLPDQKFAVVVLGNAFTFSTAKLNAALLATLFPATSAHAVAANATAPLVPAPGEDIALTGRFRGFFDALQQGHVDRSTVSDAMNAALPDASLPGIVSQVSAFGTLRKLVYRGKDEHAAGTAFHYTAVFTKQATPMTFSIDKAGKIAGMFFQ